MATTEFKNLILAIEEGNLAGVKNALDAATRENGHKKCCIINSQGKNERTPLHIALAQSNPNIDIIELLLKNGADPAVEDGSGENAWCLAIKNKQLRYIFSQKVKSPLLENLDINHTYSGTLNNKKKRIHRHGDNYLHIAAKAGNVSAFLFIYEESIKQKVRLLEYNEDHENPLHLAARSLILPAVVEGMFKHLNAEIAKLENPIKKAKEAKDRDSLAKLKENLESNKSKKNYIRNALRSSNALNGKKKTPLDCVSKEVKEEVKQTADIKDRLVDNKNFRLFLYIAATIVLVATLCISLFLLFQCAESLALATVASVCVTGIISIGAAAVSEIYKDDSPCTDMSSPNVTCGEEVQVA